MALSKQLNSNPVGSFQTTAKDNWEYYTGVSKIRLLSRPVHLLLIFFLAIVLLLTKVTKVKKWFVLTKQNVGITKHIIIYEIQLTGRELNRCFTPKVQCHTKWRHFIISIFVVMA